MGGSSKQTIGYRYRYVLQWGLTFGPCDALLRWVAGGREAWRGRQTTSGAIEVNAPELWGGDSKEGGVQGTLHIMMGESDQAPSAALEAEFGHAQPGYRGKLTAWFKGVFGSMNPYPKKSEFLVERILANWPDDAPWYPEKAFIPIKAPAPPAEIGDDWRYLVESTPSNDYSSPTFDDSAWPVGPGGFGSESPPGSTLPVGTFVSSGLVGKTIWIRRTVVSVPTEITLQIYHDDGVWVWWNGTPVTVVPTENYFHGTVTIPASDVIDGSNHLAVKVVDSIPGGSPTAIFAGVAISALPVYDGLNAMNPAHMLYESIISPREMGGQGEPAAMINDASFRGAADVLHTELFGLCTGQGESESAEEFQERILNIIGASLTQSRVDGLYYLDLIRSDYTLEDLPILNDDDILEIDVETATQVEMVNRVQVGWLDIDENQSRVTSPVTSLGLVQSVGGVISKTYEHREIPTEVLALKVAQRYLSAQPSTKYSIKANRRLYKLRKGQYFRLQSAREGIADLVCIAGELDYGELDKGAMTIKALPDVFGMPSAVFVQPASAVGSGASNPASPSTELAAFEQPYVELVASLPRERVESMPSDIGYLGVVAQRPAPDAINYSLWTAPDGAPLIDAGQRDWCPRAATVATLGPLDTAITIAGLTDKDRIAVGSWALLGNEVVRIDSLVDDVLTVGRGCADTVPALAHSPGETIWFAGDWLGGDSNEYVGGDVVDAAVQTRSPGSVLALEDSPTVSATMNDRAARPYPPALLKISDPFGNSDGVSYPTAAVGELTLSWAHRDRLLQADQLVDASMTSIGPEPGTTYTVRYYINDVLDQTEIGLTGASATPYTLTGNGIARVEVEAVRDGFVSWQAATAQFAYAQTPYEDYVDESDNQYADAGGNTYQG